MRTPDLRRGAIDVGLVGSIVRSRLDVAAGVPRILWTVDNIREITEGEVHVQSIECQQGSADLPVH